jgi:hypothetical protein
MPSFSAVVTASGESSATNPRRVSAGSSFQWKVTGSSASMIAAAAAPETGRMSSFSAADEG